MFKVSAILFFVLSLPLSAGELTGSVAIVTGGSRGVGAATVLALAKEGAHIALIVNQDLAEANEIAKEATAWGNEVLVIACDVSRPEEVDSMIEKVLAQWGNIDILVNAAKVAHRAAAEDLELKDWNKMINVNLTGTFLLCQAVARTMIAAGRPGSLINLSSISAHIVVTPQKQCHYNASKAAISMLTKSLAVEWGQYGIRVNAVSPGYIESTVPESMRALIPTWTEHIPLGRLGKVEDIAEVIVFLAGPRSRYVTGVDWIIDGGLSLQ